MAAGQITIGDVTGDGRNDIVVQSGLLELAVVPQLSNGTMSGSPDQYTIQTSYWPRFDAFAVGDLNGDTGNDVVVLDPGNSGFVNLFIQQAGGGLTRSTPFQLGVPPFAVGIADIDDNGLNDIVGLDVAPGAPYGIGMVSVYYQEATHAFLPAIVYRFDTTSGGGSSEHQLLAIGDVTGDGWPDVVAGWADEGIWVLPGVRR